MAQNTPSRKGSGAGASGAGFRRTGNQPGASRRGAFIIYTDKDHQPGFRFPFVKSFLAFGCFAALLVIVAFLRGGGEGETKPIPEEQTGGASAADPVPAFQAPSLATAFLNATTLSEKLKYINAPGEMVESVKAFYSGRSDTRDVYTSIQPAESSVNGGATNMVLEVSLAENEQRVLALVETGNGVRIDWPAFARMNTVEWAPFLNGDFEEPKPFRVYISDTDTYEGTFADPKRYKSFRITCPELGEEGFTGYAERKSRTELALSLFSTPQAKRCIIELLPPADTSSNQLTISGFVTEDWVANQ